jgi:uncharacterized iron-regulated membrane protein
VDTWVVVVIIAAVVLVAALLVGYLLWKRRGRRNRLKPELGRQERAHRQGADALPEAAQWQAMGAEETLH